MAPLARALLLSLLAAGLVTLGWAPAAAASGDDGMVRMMHLSPDTPTVDAYIDSVSTPGTQVVLPAVTYGDVSPYQSVPAGTYTVSARNAGADPASPPALATTITVEAGRAVTIAGVGAFADLTFAVLDDDLTLPPAGQARARVVNGAATASPVDLSLAGAAPLATALPFGGHTGYVDVPGGAGTLTVAAPGAPADMPVDLPVDLAAGSVYTVVVLDGDGGAVTVRTALDAASPGVVPTGGVETGAGGTAAGPGGWATLGLAVAAASAIALLLTGLLGPDRVRAPRHAAS
jgi:hypothetical protein